MKSFYRINTCFFLLLAGYFSFAQTGTGGWNVVTFKLNLNKKWSLFSEAQLRSQRFYDDFSYYEMKGGAAYSFQKKYSVLAGFGRFVSYSNGDNFKKPFVNKEWRLWEQFLVNNYPGRLKVENRLRVEQRWTTSLGYRNRLKYRLNMVLPLTDKKIKPGTLYISGWDEIYLTNADPHFELNRIYAGAGYELSRHLTVQTGYLYQVNYKPDDTYSGKHYLQVTLIIEADAYKEHHDREKTNSVAD